jgi:anti-sigma factor RsiW
MAEPAHISCQEVVELVNDYLDQALSSGEASLFEQHINFCDGCDWYLAQIRTTISTVGRISEEEVPPEARDRLLGAFREWKRR